MRREKQVPSRSAIAVTTAGGRLRKCFLRQTSADQSAGGKVRQAHPDTDLDDDGRGWHSKMQHKIDAWPLLSLEAHQRCLFQELNRGRPFHLPPAELTWPSSSAGSLFYVWSSSEVVSCASRGTCGHASGDGHPSLTLSVPTGNEYAMARRGVLWCVVLSHMLTVKCSCHRSYLIQRWTWRHRKLLFGPRPTRATLI